MAQSIYKLGILAVCGIFLFVQYGCATYPTSLPAELRAQLGRIGVVSVQYTPEPEFEGPGTGFLEHTSGAWEGLKSGAQKGAAKGIEFGTEFHPGGCPPSLIGLAVCPLFILLGLAVGVTLGATIGTIAGGLGGMTMGMLDPTDNKLTKDPALLRPIFDWYLKELGMQANIRKDVVAVAQQNTSHQVIALDKEGPAQRGSAVSYQKLKEQNLDTVLEVSVRSLGVKSTSSSDPIFSVFLVVRAELRRVADDAILYRANFTHTSPSLPLDEWMLSNALAFRMALEKGYRNLAEQIVSTLL